MRRAQRPRPYYHALALVTVIAAIAIAGCGGGPSTRSAVPATTPQPDATDNQLVASILRRDDRAFRVVFDWVDGAPGGKTGTFVWTQANGARRWDFAPEGAEGARIGWFSVESDFNAAGAPGSTTDCLWEWADAGQVRLGCDKVRPNHPGADAFTRAFTGLRLAGRFPERTIAGRNAACYAFRDAPDAFGEICVDASDGTPLAFSGTGVGRNKARHSFEATSVMPGPGTVTLPPDLSPGTPLSPARRPLAVLALPAEFTAPK